MSNHLYEVSFNNGTFIQDKDSWIKSPSWYAGSYNKINVTIKTKHDKENNKFFYHINGLSDHRQKVIDDLWILPRPEFKTFEEEVDFYQYLKCLFTMTLSDLRIMVQDIYMVGPSGICNCLNNEEKNELEKYFINVKQYDNKYVQFQSLIHDISYMEDIINTDVAKEEGFLDIPFLSGEVFKTAPFGSVRFMQVLRREKHGSLVFDDSKVNTTISYLFMPSDTTSEHLNINNKRYMFLYKRMLDYHLLNPDDKKFENFTYNAKVCEHPMVSYSLGSKALIEKI